MRIRAHMIGVALTLAILAFVPGQAFAAGGQITGTVTDASTHTGLQGVQVDVYNSNQDFVSSAQTDASGNYSISGLAPGSYEVGFYDEADSNHIAQYYNDKPTLSSADPVTVAGGSTTSGVDAALAAAGVITGTVTDASTHTPVSEVQVTVLDSAGHDVGDSSTASDGRYSVGGLPAGTYRVQFTPADDQPYGQQYYSDKATFTGADGVSVTGGQTTSAINAQLVAGARITGTVTDASSSQPIVGAEVDVFAADGAPITGTETDSGGRYTVGGLAPGSYELKFSSGGSSGNYAAQYYNAKATLATGDGVSTTAGHVVSANAALTVGGEIKGTIIDAQSHQPLLGVNVTALDASGNEVSFASSASDGTYSLVGLATGTYTVAFAPNDNLHLALYYNDRATAASADPVSVTAGQSTTGIDAGLQVGGAITGVVTDAAAAAPLAGISVEAYDANGDFVEEAASAQDGSYTLGGLSAGNYHVSFASPEYDSAYTSQYYNGAATLSAATPVAVTLGQTSAGIDAAMQGGGSIDGTVTDAASGQAIADVEVTINSSGGSYYDAYTPTDANGHYFIGGLPAGTYTASFIDPSGSHLEQLYNGKASSGTADPISVSTGQTTHGINAALQAAGKIAGTVTDATTHQTLAGISVYASGSNGYGYATTSADGTYTIGGLSSGAYTVSFSTNGAASYLTQYYNGRSDSTSADEVTVSDGQATTAINAAMQPGGAISGTVSDAQSGKPLSGASVTVYDASGDYVASTATASGGSYIVGGLASGSYRVGFETANESAYLSSFYNAKGTLATADPVAVTVGQTTSQIDGRLQPAGAISGTVTDAPLGAPLPNTEVYVYDANGNVIGSAQTDPNGAYKVAGLPAGGYRVGFSSGSYGEQYYNAQGTLATANTVSVSTGQTTSSIDIAMKRKAVIEGTVTAAAGATPLSGVSVEVLNSSGDPIDSTTTDSSGSYAIGALSAGSYTIGFFPTQGMNYLSQYYDGQASQANATTLTLSDGDIVQGIDGQLAVGGEISGHVADAVSDTPLQGVTVTANGQTGDGYGTATTDANGDYTIAGLTSDSYNVYFDSQDGSYVNQQYNNEPTDASGNLVAVTTGQATSGIDAAMQPAARISGTVTDASTHVGIERIQATVYGTNGDYINSTETDLNGAYTIGGLPTGTYRVEFSNYSSSDYIPQYYNDKGTLASANGVTTSAGQTTSGIDAAMQLGGQITGTVTDSSTHAPITDSPVYVYDAAGGYVSSVYTGSDGSYTVSSLPTGSYRLEFTGSGPYISQYYNGKTTLATADPVAVTAGSTTANIDGALQNGGQVTGAVTDSSTDKPISGASVYLYGPTDMSATTNAQGIYTVAGLPTGSYRVEFSASGYLTQYYNNATAYNSSEPVAVTIGQTTSNIAAAMQLGGQITGTVTDANGGQPVADETVYAYSSSNYLASASTDTSGHYQLTGLPTGSYTVDFGVYGVGPDYVPQYYDGRQCSVPQGTTTSAVEAEYGANNSAVEAEYGGNVTCTATSAGASPVAATDGQTSSGIDAAMQPGAQITGAVTDASTQAKLQYIDATVYDSSGDYLAQTYTAANGTYTLDAMPAGSYKVEFSNGYDNTGYLPQYYNAKASLSAADLVALASAQTATGINAAMQTGGKITGTVTDASTQEPIASVYVYAYDSNGNYVASADTNSNGVYTITGLATGSYRVEFEPYSGGYFAQYYNDEQTLSTADPVAVTAGNTTTSINAALSQGGSITGTITDATSGTAASGIAVTAYSYTTTSTSYAGSATTDSTGRYSITGLNTANYKVEFSGAGYLTQYYNDRQTLTSADTVNVTYGQASTGINAAIQEAGAITGTVTDASSQAGLANALVTAYNSQGSSIESTYTGTSGSYQLSSLPAGGYRVGFSAGTNQNYLPQYYNGKASLSTANQITVTAGHAAPGINAALQPGGQIQGTVTDASTNAPVSGIYVYAYAANGAFVSEATSAADGSYTISGLPTGTYDIEFNAANQSQNYVPQYYNGQSTFGAANAVAVTAGKTAPGSTPHCNPAVRFRARSPPPAPTPQSAASSRPRLLPAASSSPAPPPTRKVATQSTTCQPVATTSSSTATQPRTTCRSTTTGRARSLPPTASRSPQGGRAPGSTPHCNPAGRSPAR